MKEVRSGGSVLRHIGPLPSADGPAGHDLQGSAALAILPRRSRIGSPGPIPTRAAAPTARVSGTNEGAPNRAPEGDAAAARARPSCAGQ
jgi:hypothetical protein